MSERAYTDGVHHEDSLAYLAATETLSSSESLTLDHVRRATDALRAQDDDVPCFLDGAGGRVLFFRDRPPEFLTPPPALSPESLRAFEAWLWQRERPAATEVLRYPRLIAGDSQSAVPPDTVALLVDFAREGRREDFDFLAGSAGIPKAQHEEVWQGARARLGLEA